MADFKEVIKQPVTDELLRKIVRRINTPLKVEKIILFGSYAYGKPKKNSDLDLFIIMKSRERPAKRIMKISQLFWHREVPMDFIVKTPSEIAKRIAIGDFFIQKILKQGKVLYERKNN